MAKVMVFGTFDILHKGHRYFLGEARKHGDFLTVVVARDQTVLKVKGRQAHNNESIRLANIKNAMLADRVILGHEGADKFSIIEEERPDVICLGYDQTSFTDTLEEEMRRRGVNVKIVRIGSYKPHVFKSSKLRDMLPDKNKSRT